jgi:DNA-binding NtrC family response regulator
MPSFMIKPVVLIVEDESLIRLSIADALDDAGCDVIEAADGAEAQSLVLQRSDIWLLFSDIVMPGGIDGLSLLHEVHESHPHIRLMLTSGQPTPDAAKMPPQTLFFPKPYWVSDVADHVLALRA